MGVDSLPVSAGLVVFGCEFMAIVIGQLIDNTFGKEWTPEDYFWMPVYALVFAVLVGLIVWIAILLR